MDPLSEEFIWGYVKTAKMKEKNAFGEENFLSQKTTLFEGKFLEKTTFLVSSMLSKKHRFRFKK